MIIIDVVTYALLQKRITSALSGVKDIKREGNQTIIFTTNDGQEFKIKIPTPDLVWVGDEPPAADSEYELWVDTSDGGVTPLNRAILTEPITSGIDIGSVVKGTTFGVGDPLEDVLRAMLTLKQKPKVTIGINPATNIYDITTEELAELTISANVTKGSSDIAKVRFYIDNVLVQTITENVEDGGVIKYTMTFDPPQKKTFVVKADALDIEDQVGASQTTINFIAPSYYGFLPEDTTFDEDAIKSLDNKELKIKKELTYKEITTPGTDSYYITYCYPKELGAITSITDNLNFEYIQDYNVKEIVIDDVDYILMHQKDPGSVEDFLQKFV